MYQFLDGFALIFAFSSSGTGRDRCLAIAAATIWSWSSGGGTRSQALWFQTSWSSVKNLSLKGRLKRVCRERPSAAYLEPNGALSFVSCPFSSRVRADVVAAKSWLSVVALVVDSLIVVEDGDQK